MACAPVTPLQPVDTDDDNDEALSYCPTSQIFVLGGRSCLTSPSVFRVWGRGGGDKGGGIEDKLLEGQISALALPVHKVKGRHADWIKRKRKLAGY